MHYIEQYKVIVQVSVDFKNQDNATFIFFNHATLSEIQRLSVPKRHFNCLMTANDVRKEESKDADDGFFAVLFTDDDDLDAYQLVRFTIDSKKKWQFKLAEVQEE